MRRGPEGRIGLRSLEVPPGLRASTPCRQRGSRSGQSPLRIGRHPTRVSSPLGIACAPAQDPVAPCIGQNKGLPTHPPEPAYPCCLPALGEFCEVTPHEEPRPSLRHNRHPRQRGRRHAATDCAWATNRAWATDHPRATNRADRGNAQTRQPTAHRRRSRRQSIDRLSAQQPDANATTRNRQRAHSSMRNPL